MSMNFFETVMGRRFIEGTVPKLVKSIDRLADAVEKMDQPEAPVVVAEFPLSAITDFIKSVNAQEWLSGDAFDDFGVCHRQLRSLWTAFCIIHKYDVDHMNYDIALHRVWNVLDQITGIAASQHTFADFDAFDEYMCADLV